MVLKTAETIRRGTDWAIRGNQWRARFRPERARDVKPPRLNHYNWSPERRAELRRDLFERHASLWEELADL